MESVDLCQIQTEWNQFLEKLHEAREIRFSMGSRRSWQTSRIASNPFMGVVHWQASAILPAGHGKLAGIEISLWEKL